MYVRALPRRHKATVPQCSSGAHACTRASEQALNCARAFRLARPHTCPQARTLGAWLRRRYVEELALLPPQLQVDRRPLLSIAARASEGEGGGTLHGGTTGHSSCCQWLPPAASSGDGDDHVSSP